MYLRVYDAGDELLVKPPLEGASDAQGRHEAAVRDEVLPDAVRVYVADHPRLPRHHFRRSFPPARGTRGKYGTPAYTDSRPYDVLSNGWMAEHSIAYYEGYIHL